MKKLKLILDTSVYSAMIDDRDPIRQQLTREFWNNIDNYDLFYAEINVEELDAVRDEEIKTKLKSFLNKGKIIDTTAEVEELTKVYINEDIIPEKYESDAIFLALTTVHSLDILISWNFRHLVKRKTRLGVNLINLKLGYKTIEILAPPEL